jgi:hypothetical protein
LILSALKKQHKVALFSAESINYSHSALHSPAAHIQRYGYGAALKKWLYMA